MNTPLPRQLRADFCDHITAGVLRQMRPRPLGRLRRFAASIIVLVGLRGEPAATPIPPPAETFFAPAGFYRPKLSPDGSKVCALTLFNDKYYALTMTELSSKKTQYVVKTPGLSVLNFWWKSDGLMLVIVRDDFGSSAFRALDLRTGKTNELTDLLSYQGLELLNVLPDDPEEMLFCATTGREPYDQPGRFLYSTDGKSRYLFIDTAYNNIIKVNLRTGKETRIESDPGGVLFWLTDRSGAAIAAWGQERKKRFLLWRSNPTAKWQRKDETLEKLPEMIPLAVASDQRRLLVRDYRRTSVARISLYDPATDAYEEVCAPGEVEPDGIQSWGHADEPGAIVSETDRRRLHFLNAEAEGANQWMEKALPGTERAYSSFAHDNSRAIVVALNNRNPGVYCALNFATRRVTIVGAAFPAINPAIQIPCKPYFDTSMISTALIAPVGPEI